jgi:CRISP-associated protein Cas1
MNASDEINALLNYGYAILESTSRKQINIVGLDPCIGFVHEIDKSKTPLVYDVQEMGRWIIDLSVIELLEEKKLKKSDFIVTENYHIRLKEQTSNMLIKKYNPISIIEPSIWVRITPTRISYLAILQY